MLTHNPKMLPRLDELEADLVERRAHATANGWKGELEGIDLTLTFLRSKRTQTRRAVSLGMPALPATSVQPGHNDRMSDYNSTGWVAGYLGGGSARVLASMWPPLVRPEPNEG